MKRITPLCLAIVFSALILYRCFRPDPVQELPDVGISNITLEPGQNLVGATFCGPTVVTLKGSNRVSRCKFFNMPKGYEVHWDRSVIYFDDGAGQIRISGCYFEMISVRRPQSMDGE